MNRIAALVVAAPLALAACQQSGPPIVYPVPIPTITMPPEVQKACQVLQWAVPIAAGFAHLSPAIQRYVDAATPALTSCAAGNANASIIDLAISLQQLLTQRGVRAPVGVPVLRR